MPNCPKCNASVAPGARFCPSCGTAISSASHCPSCGSEVASGALFCTKCGTRIAAAPQTTQTPQPSVNIQPGLALGANIPAMPQTPAPPIQPQQAQPQPQITPAPASDAPVAKKYTGLKVLKIILWVLAIFFMASAFYHFLSYFVYSDHGYYNYYLDMYCSRYKDLFEIYSRGSIGGYYEEVTIGFIVSLVLSAIFLVPAIIVSKVRKKMILRQQETVK